MTTRLAMPDAELAAFATPGWVERVAQVPLAEVPAMVAEDPSTVHALIGALRHARAELVRATSDLVVADKNNVALSDRIEKLTGDLLRARARLELGREHVRRGRTLFTPAPDGTTADFKLGLELGKLGLEILLDNLAAALAEPTS